MIELVAQMLMVTDGQTQETHSQLMVLSGKIETGTTTETILTETMLTLSLTIPASGLIRTETAMETGRSFQMATSSLMTRLNGVISMATDSETTQMVIMETSAQNYTVNLPSLLQEDALILTMTEL